MSIIIEKDGWKISGDTIAEVEFGVRALAQGLAKVERQRQIHMREDQELASREQETTTQDMIDC